MPQPETSHRAARSDRAGMGETVPRYPADLAANACPTTEWSHAMTTIPEVPAELEAAAQRIQELSTQVVEKAKENGLAWLEGYERMLKNFLDLEEKAAKNSGADWATSLATTHANFVRETS